MIYLPPCYQDQKGRHYPVLYLIHGKNYSHDQWDRIGADEVADKFVAAGEAAPFIIVMPQDRLGIEPPEDQFGEAILAELIPWIDKSYRTIPEREYRAIGGLSRGAAWAIHLGLGHWEVFGAVGAHSMALFWGDVADIPLWLEEMQPEGTPRIFVDVGRKDFEEIRNSSAWFRDLLTEMDIPHEWYSFAGTHDEDYWRSHLELYMRFYTLEW
jgi:enterochelin esterase-like enzyme